MGSPLINVSATNLDIPNDAPVILAMEVTNNDRNLQIPIDDLADGFNIKLQWSSTSESQLVNSGAYGAGQVWAKKQPGGACAALIINTGSSPIKNYNLEFAKLNLTSGAYSARDIWARKDIGSFKEQLSLSVPPYDSAFVLL